MDNLRRLGSSISIAIQPGEDGYTGRECPNPTCEGYFKIVCGTGLKGEGLPCHCPYCGHTASHQKFWTKEQIEYAKSVAFRRVADAFTKDLKALEFDIKPRGPFGIGISMKLQPATPPPIRWYREKTLETHVECDECTLKYAVFGVFAFCPDCGKHNSIQILDKNIELAGKMLDLALTSEKLVAERLVENALEDCVSAFDGFGRELSRIHAKDSAATGMTHGVSFQNLESAKRYLAELGIDLAAAVSPEEWKIGVRCFQKRHLLSHKMGVVDQDYVRKSRDEEAIVGRKVIITAGEVRAVARVVTKLARAVEAGFKKSL